MSLRTDVPITSTRKAVVMSTAALISAPSAVVAQDLRLTRDGRSLLAGVDLTVAPGESVAVLGSGDDVDAPLALLQVVAGLAVPDAGWIQWGGHDLLRLTDSAKSVLRRRDVGVALDGGSLLPELPVLQNIALPLLLDGLPHRAAVSQAADLLDTIGLSGAGARKVADLCGRSRALVSLGRALVTRPALVVVDDPTRELAPGDASEVLDLLTGACVGIGAALLLGTTESRTATRCSRTVVITGGRACHLRDRPLVEAAR